VAQLRVSPDRFASIEPSNLISYNFTVKNIGLGDASAVTLRFPIDPNLTLGYATNFNDPKIWVKAIVTDTAQPYVLIILPDLQANSPPISGTLVFRPEATSGAVIFTKYQVSWNDDEKGGKTTLSNGVRYQLSSDNTNRNDSNGAIQFFDPATLTATNDQTFTVTGDFYIPNELVTFWYTDKNGVSVSLGTTQADGTGRVVLEIKPSNLKAGEVYNLVGYGNRSEVSGSSVITAAS
jgi:hypothetical protein